MTAVKPRLLPVTLMAVIVLGLGAGCTTHRHHSSPARYQDTPGSFGDLNARAAYVDERVKELTATGMSRQAAEARSAREWFARAPAASQQPTTYELERRAAQADLDSYLENQQTTKKR